MSQKMCEDCMHGHDLEDGDVVGYGSIENYIDDLSVEDAADLLDYLRCKLDEPCADDLDNALDVVAKNFERSPFDRWRVEKRLRDANIIPGC